MMQATRILAAFGARAQGSSLNKLALFQDKTGQYFSTSVGCLKSGWPELTSERYQIKRKDYAQLTEKDVDYFRGVLCSDGQVLTGDDVMAYNVDWLKTVRGCSELVLKPRTTKDVSEILQYCNSRGLAVVPQGGNTGLVGGSVPVFDEIVISTELMNNIINIDKLPGILVCQSGCILENLDNHLADYNLMMPLDLGAKGSCHIGGNVATNAGGTRLLRYGSLHGSVLGLEAVLANGEIVDCLTSLRKDNTGYDLKQLFIGSEGTLGMVTAVSILCPQRPSSVNVAFLGCGSFEHVLETFQEAKGMLGEILSAFEFMDEASMTCIKDNVKLSNPVSDCPFYILLETAGSNDEHDLQKLNSFLENLLSKSIVQDGTIASEPSKIKSLWQLRERLAEGLLHDGYCFKYDISLPLDQYYTFVEVMRERVAGICTRMIGYGHVGDGNLHFNVTSPEFSKQLKNAIEPFIYEYTSKYRGSISAEHGLGFMKNNYIGYSKPPAAVNVMHQIKNLLDPKGILNPYKTLPSN